MLRDVCNMWINLEGELRVIKGRIGLSRNVGVCTKINKLVNISEHGIYAHKTTEHMKLYIQLTYEHHPLARRSNIQKRRESL